MPDPDAWGWSQWAMLTLLTATLIGVIGHSIGISNRPSYKAPLIVFGVIALALQFAGFWAPS